MKGLFGGLVAITLLGLYVYAVYMAINGVETCVLTQGCTAVPPGNFTDGMALVMSSIGGIVSALVIAELAVTQPGKQPIGMSFTADLAALSPKFVKIVTAVYLLVWLGVGLWAFIIGVMQYPKLLEPLTNLGLAWLGLAVSAVYAYLGIKPPEQPPIPTP